jgi:hypothetical protein
LELCIIIGHGRFRPQTKKRVQDDKVLGHKTTTDLNNTNSTLHVQFMSSPHGQQKLYIGAENKTRTQADERHLPIAIRNDTDKPDKLCNEAKPEPRYYNSLTWMDGRRYAGSLECKQSRWHLVLTSALPCHIPS